MPHELYLLRHGETEWNREGRIQGSQDSPLTARGREQATAQADILAREVPQMWQLARYCSPLRRARDTARIALDGLVPVIDRRLREVDFGAWEGLTPAERGARDPQLVAGCAGDLDLCRSAPGGEGLIGLETRLRGFLADLRAPSIIVSHKIVLMVLRGVLTDRPAMEWDRIDVPQGVVFRIGNGRETVLH